MIPSATDRALMTEALVLAAECAASSDVPVGAVVADSTGRIVGRGFNQREATADPTAHAEVLALRSAAETLGSWRLDGCTLVVTLEPCVMCAGAALNARISRLVFGADEPKTGAAGSLIEVLRNPRYLHQVEVLPGVMAAESAKLLSQFFATKRTDLL